MIFTSMTEVKEMNIKRTKIMEEFIHLTDDMSLFFEELEALRESGIMNMYGAPAWLQENYDLSRKEAIFVFLEWKDKKEREVA